MKILDWGKHKARLAVSTVVGQTANYLVKHARVDPRISYPCYKSMDEYIDVERLKSLDELLVKQIFEQGCDREDGAFGTGGLHLNRKDPRNPGSKVILLAKATGAHRYLDLDKPECWERSPDAEKFPELMALIDTLPFKATARMTIFYDNSAKAVTAHRDHPWTKICHEFIWFRTNLNKPFYVMDNQGRNKKYVKSYAAWFDTCNQYHGADACDAQSVSLRVDGIFTDEFRAKIPVPKYNRASTPSLWAALAGENEDRKGSVTGATRVAEV